MAIKYLGDQNPDGTVLGYNSSEKVAFWGATATTRPSGAGQAAVASTAPTSTNPYGFTTSTQAAAIVTLVNQMRSDLVALGLLNGS